MLSIKQQYQTILHQLEQDARHPYLSALLGQPPIPKEFVRLVHLFLSAQSLSMDRKSVLTLAIAYLHMALTLHESVSSSSPKNPSSFQKQQLTVLAGDFYSSLFYRKLSEAEELEAIEKLAIATSQIQEQKMKEYWDGNLLPTEHLVSQGLFRGLIDLFGSKTPYFELWEALFTSFLSIKDGDMKPLERFTQIEDWLPTEIIIELQDLQEEWRTSAKAR